MAPEVLSTKRASVTRLLQGVGGDRGQLLRELAPLVYSELHSIASAQLRDERPGHTLQPTALVNEAWLRLVDHELAGIDGRRTFYAASARVIRNVLVDYARRRQAHKRGGDAVRVELSEVDPAGGCSDEVDLEALDVALSKLEELHPQLAQVVELRYFGGLEVTDVAKELGTSPATVKRHWALARAFLFRTLKEQGS